MNALALALQVVATGGMSADTALAGIHNYVAISDGLATSGQMTYDQIEDVANAGFDVVINLAPARQDRNGREGFLIAEYGITYVNIPVDWEEPLLRDLETFFAVMDASRDRKVLVHCFANMRASAFTYLYRTLVLDEDETAARRDMEVVWDPASQVQWGRFLESARSRYPTRRSP
ncbi:MAG: protein tyrosine phosphatase family protein [Gemmatimonadetes bacterium]|nr:protein tyrosine phosphatase family protein [Gemmatimonadota bacterium]